MLWHSWVMHLYQNDMQLAMLPKFLGYEGSETTPTYTYTDTALKHQAVEKASKDSLVTDIMDDASIWKSQDIYATLSSDKLKIFQKIF